MEEYVSYHKIIQLFQDYQISQQGIGLNSFGHGNVVMFGMTESGMTPTYPFLFVTPQNISYDENIITYTMQLIFADRINDDMSNEIDVISDMDIQARRFMSYIRRGMNQDPPLWNYMDCNLPLTGLPFLERFNDYVGGVTIDMEVIIRTDINACDYYDFLPSPTPSITPTNIPTPTITPTNTGTPTPTPTSTPASYSISFVSSGATFNDLCSNPQSIPTLYSPQPFFTNAQQLYYDSALTQFIDWNTYSIFASTGGTQLYSYAFAAMGLSTYGFTCPSPTPTPTNTTTTTPTNTPTVTPTNTTTPTITPTINVTPSPAAQRTYRITYSAQKAGGSYPSAQYRACDGLTYNVSPSSRGNVGQFFDVCVCRYNNTYPITTDGQNAPYWTWTVLTNYC